MNKIAKEMAGYMDLNGAELVLSLMNEPEHYALVRRDLKDDVVKKYCLCSSGRVHPLYFLGKKILKGN